MQVNHFALGIRFDLLRANMSGVEEAAAGKNILQEIFSVLTVSDLKGLAIFAGRDTTLSDGDIYIVVIDGGSLKEMQRIYAKISEDAGIGMYLSHSLPYIENNRLLHVDGLTCFGRVEKDGSLSGGDAEPFGLAVPLKRGKKRPVGRGIKLLLAPDSFGRGLSSESAIKRLTFAARRHLPGVQVVPVPMAAGGEGTVRAMVTSGGGSYRKCTVASPLGERITATYGVLRGRVGIIEAAEAAGFSRVPSPDIMAASSAGVGELIRRALDEGLQDIVIGLGDVITNDCGMGLARELGVKFYDASGAELAGCGADLIKVSTIDLEYLHPLIKTAHFTIMSGSACPLLGESGVTLTYGALRGGTPSQLTELEEGMRHFSAMMYEATGKDVSLIAGAGEAGGIGAMLMSLFSPAVKYGIDALLDALEFDKLLSGVALAVTGGEALDSASLCYGGVIAGIMRRCTALNVPVAVIAGSIGEGAEELYTLGNAGVMPIINAPMTPDEARGNVEQLFDAAADRMFRFIRMGRDVEKIGAPKPPKVAAFPMPPELIQENLELARKAMGVKDESEILTRAYIRGEKE